MRLGVDPLDDAVGFLGGALSVREYRWILEKVNPCAGAARGRRASHAARYANRPASLDAAMRMQHQHNIRIVHDAAELH